jgi:hypothetical protein
MVQAIATLADFEVNPSVMVQTCELVFVNELIGNVLYFVANVFVLGHGSVKVEVLKVDGAKACTFSREYTVEEELEKFQQCCVSTHIARVADAVATNGDPCVVRVILVWMDFTYYHGMAYLISLVQRDVMVVDAKERVGTGYMIGAGAFPEPMPWQRRPSSLAYKVSHVVLYQGSLRSWQCSSILPVVGSSTDKANRLSL